MDKNNKNVEMMKKLIEAKKNKGTSGVGGKRPEKNMGSTSKGFRIGNGGGFFDK